MTSNRDLMGTSYVWRQNRDITNHLVGIVAGIDPLEDLGKLRFLTNLRSCHLGLIPSSKHLSQRGRTVRPLWFPQKFKDIPFPCDRPHEKWDGIYHFPWLKLNFLFPIPIVLDVLELGQGRSQHRYRWSISGEISDFFPLVAIMDIYVGWSNPGPDPHSRHRTISQIYECWFWGSMTGG